MKGLRGRGSGEREKSIQGGMYTESRDAMSRFEMR
jgi:hypothetical protein